MGSLPQDLLKWNQRLSELQISGGTHVSSSAQCWSQLKPLRMPPFPHLVGFAHEIRVWIISSPSHLHLALRDPLGLSLSPTKYIGSRAARVARESPLWYFPCWATAEQEAVASTSLLQGSPEVA